MLGSTEMPPGWELLEQVGIARYERLCEAVRCQQPPLGEPVGHHSPLSTAVLRLLFRCGARGQPA